MSMVNLRAGDVQGWSPARRLLIGFLFASVGAGVVFAALKVHIAQVPIRDIQVAGPAPASSARLQALEQRAMQYFSAGMSPEDTRSFEGGFFTERAIVFDKQRELKQINVQSQCGDVIVMHNPNPEVAVLTGKQVVAQTTARARAYARELKYTVKRDGDTMSVTISGPDRSPRDIYMSSVRCIVFAPRGVKVATASGI